MWISHFSCSQSEMLEDAFNRKMWALLIRIAIVLIVCTINLIAVFRFFRLEFIHCCEGSVALCYNNLICFSAQNWKKYTTVRKTWQNSSAFYHWLSEFAHKMMVLMCKYYENENLLFDFSCQFLGLLVGLGSNIFQLSSFRFTQVSFNDL